jgi:hypothetical protein
MAAKATGTLGFEDVASYFTEFRWGETQLKQNENENENN